MFKKLLFINLSLLLSPSVVASSTYELERIVTAQSQLLTQYQQNIFDLQNEIDVLRGQLQETSYKLDQTIERQKMMLKQLDNYEQIALSNGEKGRLKAANTSLADWHPTGDDKIDYNYILDYILKGKELDSAIVSLQRFAKHYTLSHYLSNINYWLGQLNYQKNKKAEASYYFANVVKKYPKSAKVAESMFKIGLILQQEGQLDKANMMFEQVIKKYPNETIIVTKAKQQLKK